MEPTVQLDAPNRRLPLTYVPLVDGYVVPDDPAVLMGTNNQLKLPLLIGHNVDEGLFYARDLHNPNGGGLPQWPAYRSPDYRLLDFGDAMTERSNARSAEIEFFQQAFETMRRKPLVPPPSAK